MKLSVTIDNQNPQLPHVAEDTFQLSASGMAPLVHNAFIFKGDGNNPFLAPRGVWLVNNMLFVSDTGQNRVFIWKKFPESEAQSPDVVLGQIHKDDTGRNAGHGTTASSLQYPSGLWSDGQKLIVADAWNHRVLIWHSIPTTNGQAADVVIGQPDFTQNLPNVHGIGSLPSAQTVNWPYGVFSDGTNLWVCDTGNRRVLFYKKIPTANYTPADEVIGKPNFTERDYENNEPIWPYSVRVSACGKMCITDTQFYRQLIWNDWKTAHKQTADIIIGQPDFDACGQNQYQLFPAQNTLNWTYDSFFYKSGIFLADTGNSRILWYEGIPSQSSALATNLIGHKNYTTGSENANTRFGTEKQLYWPFSICIENNQMVVADTGNHRIIKYDLL